MTYMLYYFENLSIQGKVNVNCLIKLSIIYEQIDWFYIAVVHCLVVSNQQWLTYIACVMINYIITTMTKKQEI